MIALDLGHDAVVGRVTSRACRVGDEDLVVDAFGQIGERPAVEHDRDASPVRAVHAWSDCTSRRAAPGRSRHQPSGRLPITLFPSTIQRGPRAARRWCSPARARVDETWA